MSCWLNVLLDVHSGCFVRSLLRALLFAWMEEQKQLMFFREHTKHCEPLCHSVSFSPVICLHHIFHWFMKHLVNEISICLEIKV